MISDVEDSILKDKNFCRCGCGSEIPFRSKSRGELMRFKHGHNRPFGKLSDNPSWKGGIRKHSGGYIRIYKPDHHYAVDGYVREHRLVWEEYNNAILLPWADVHHKDKNTSNNKIENLEAMMNYQHMSITNIGRSRTIDLSRNQREHYHKLWIWLLGSDDRNSSWIGYPSRIARISLQT
jgi:hypothetical protein